MRNYLSFSDKAKIKSQLNSMSQISSQIEINKPLQGMALTEGCVLAYLLLCLLAYLLLACLLANLLACLIACLPACLPTCLGAFAHRQTDEHTT